MELKDRILELEAENLCLKQAVKTFEKQIEAGEMVPVEVAACYVQRLVKSIADKFGYNHPFTNLADDLKQFAAQRAGEAIPESASSVPT